MSGANKSQKSICQSDSFRGNSGFRECGCFMFSHRALRSSTSTPLKPRPPTKDIHLRDSLCVLPTAIAVLPISHGDVVIHRAPVVKLPALPHHCPSHFYPHVERLHLRAAGIRAWNQRLVVVLWGRNWWSSEYCPGTLKVKSLFVLDLC